MATLWSQHGVEQLSAAGALKYLPEPGRSGVATAIAPDFGQKAGTYLSEILR